MTKYDDILKEVGFTKEEKKVFLDCLAEIDRAEKEGVQAVDAVRRIVNKGVIQDEVREDTLH